MSVYYYNVCVSVCRGGLKVNETEVELTSLNINVGESKQVADRDRRRIRSGPVLIQYRSIHTVQ